MGKTIMRVALKSLALALCMASSSAQQWKQLTAAAPWAGRSDPQLVHLNGKLLLMGGHDGTKASNYFNDVWQSPDAGKSWQQLPDAPWKPRSYHTVKVFGNEAYLLAGHDNGTWYNDVWKTADGASWELVTAEAEWSPRAATALQVRRGVMYLFGGSNGLLKPIGHGQVMNDVWRSTDGATWTQCTAAAPWAAREGLQKLSTVYGPDDQILMTSGEAGYFGPYYHDLWGSYDGQNWTEITSDTGFSGRSGNLLAELNGSLFTFGGYGFPMKHDAYCLPPGNASATWTKLGSAPWHGRFDYDMEVVNSSIVLLGGEASLFGAGGPYFNDVWVYEQPTCP